MVVTINDTSALAALLGRVSLKGTCLDFDWRWNIAEQAGGWLIALGFTAPDRDTLQRSAQEGRRLWVAKGASSREVAGTAFTALKLALEHELLEAFTIGGCRAFDPHGLLGGLP